MSKKSRKNQKKFSDNNPKKRNPVMEAESGKTKLIPEDRKKSLSEIGTMPWFITFGPGGRIIYEGLGNPNAFLMHLLFYIFWDAQHPYYKEIKSLVLQQLDETRRAQAIEMQKKQIEEAQEQVIEAASEELDEILEGEIVDNNVVDLFEEDAVDAEIEEQPELNEIAELEARLAKLKSEKL